MGTRNSGSAHPFCAARGEAAPAIPQRGPAHAAGPAGRFPPLPRHRALARYREPRAAGCPRAGGAAEPVAARSGGADERARGAGRKEGWAPARAGSSPGDAAISAARLLSEKLAKTSGREVLTLRVGRLGSETPDIPGSVRHTELPALPGAFTRQAPGTTFPHGGPTTQRCLPGHGFRRAACPAVRRTTPHTPARRDPCRYADVPCWAPCSA